MRDTLFRDLKPTRVFANSCHTWLAFQSTFTHQTDHRTPRRRSLAIAGVIPQTIIASQAPASGTQP